jgi:hypothetical protein
MWYSHNLISDSTYAGLMRYCGYADVARDVASEQQRCVSVKPDAWAPGQAPRRRRSARLLMGGKPKTL